MEKSDRRKLEFQLLHTMGQSTCGTGKSDESGAKATT